MSEDTLITAAAANSSLARVEVQGMTRSSFLVKGALATGALYGASAVMPYIATAFGASGGGDVEILNFALTLEYLESDFYNVKAKEVGLSGKAKSYAKLFGEEEADHVNALMSVIKQMGGKPVAQPRFAFPVSSQRAFLALASVLENTGVGAYNGAGPALQSKQVLAAAGGIVQIEARHAAAIDLLIGKSPTPNQGFDRPLSKAQVLAKAGPLIKM
ncbi:MAG TPA: ferritin-like domain-containing protein [Solirubrobacteraceae bacterium]|jgi:hypothetical protein